jgi:hypothetical protein
LPRLAYDGTGRAVCAGRDAFLDCRNVSGEIAATAFAADPNPRDLRRGGQPVVAAASLKLHYRGRVETGGAGIVSSVAESGSEDSGSFGSWEAGDDEFVGVIDHVLEVGLVDGSVQCHGVPVPFVRVVSGLEGGVLRAEVEGPIRVAFEVHEARVSGQHDQCEHLATDLVHGNVVTERLALRRLGSRCAGGENVVSVHWRVYFGLV